MVSLSPPDLEYRRPMDLHADAVRLCIALQSQLNPGFLGAATHLLSCGALPPAEFRRHSRKIIRLIQTARDTLEVSGISLYLFTSCQQPKCTYKAVYFDLLRMLHARRCNVDVALQARTNSLLIRLSSNFVGRNSSAASKVAPAGIQLPDKSRQTLAMGITTCTPQPPKSTAPCSSMPAPDAFPPSPAPLIRRRKRPRRSEPFSVVPEVVARPRKRARVAADRENQIPVSAPAPVTYVYKAPPLTKRFGIFCTGKTSMHRPRSVRAC
ncbi:hypothetical protein B0H17DRAFT_1049589 [Mycena rosella]|uniref:Uncharacterized protein n=1 Tax=Mycena rosella TaxID=1033263 RepID=A0AAD7DUH9_MYCRO|nr:hypothetical protein B0H17DRAFT_1049589 [Mycena rosella]